jgi:eukaryotic-like serine/threonine-protein kinase
VAPDAVPEQIGPFRIESELGQGMMGVVYKAQDTRTRRRVALKIIRVAFAMSDEQKAAFERRFMEEAQIVARLDHPGIVGVFEIGRDPEQDAPYIAFEYLEGQTLSEMLEQGPLPWRTALVIVARVAEALEHAHRQGVIHRDIKPANIMILRPGSPSSPAKKRAKDSRRGIDSDLGVKIMDFGLAKREAGLELTSTGQFLGTPLYMSPEQALGRKVDARTDIFSLGSVAYTLLSGKRAFEGDSIPQVMNKVTYQNPPPPSRLKRELTAEVDYLVGRAMAKAPESRYPTAFAFAEDINDVWHGRKPRHRAGWTAPSVAEGTMESPIPKKPAKRKGDGPSGDNLPILELEPIQSALPLEPPRRRGGSASALWLLLLTAAVGASFYWRGEILGAVAGGAASPGPTVAPSAAPPAIATAPIPAPRATEPPAIPPPTEAGVVPASSPTAETTLAPTAPPTPTEAPATARPLPPVTPAPVKAAPTSVPRRTPRKTPTPKARPRPVETGKLSFRFEHHLRSGTLRVWLDDDKMIEAALTSRVTQDLKLVKLRTGKIQRLIGVTPGTHRIRVEVRSGEDIKVKETTAIFKAGVTRRLQASVNRVTGGLSLDWQ